jgi:hypothetical protein
MKIETSRSKEFRSDNSRRSHDSYGGLLARLCLVVTIFAAPGCATTREGQSSSQDAGRKENCSRLAAAAHAYHEKINPNKMLKKAKQDCDAGDMMACLAIPGAWPMGVYFEVFLAPVLIPILAMDPATPCPQKPSTPQAGATASDSQPIDDHGEPSGAQISPDIQSK